MSVQADFFALLEPVFSGQLYRNFAPAPTVPYATFFRVTAAEESSLDTNGGTGNVINTRLQLDIYGSTGSQVDALASAAKAALKAWGTDNVILLEQDMYEAEPKLHRVMLDISTWHL